MQWALSYPFARPPQDYVFIDGESYSIVSHGASVFDSVLDVHGDERALEEVLGAQRMERLEAQMLHPVLAIGSNASPVQMRRKFHGDPDGVFIPVLRADVRDASIRFMNRIAAYCSIAVTTTPEPGSTCVAAVTFLPEREREVIDGSEALGKVYDTIEVAVDLADASWRVGSGSEAAYRCLSGDIGLGAATAENKGSAVPNATQWDAQQTAIRMLGLSMSVEEFVLQNLRDPKLRRERDALLREIRV